MKNNINTFAGNYRFIVAIVILNIADFVLTKELLGTGLVKEANPILSWLIHESGTVWSIVWAKSFGIGILIYFSFIKSLPEKLMHFVIWIYAVVVIYSFSLLSIYS